ncbi:uncharacterized protein A4U43_C02F9380 [Asparagus officinalis]|uniref:Uncharacterized protein n=1 Tax=Asparagus officinalis TaxID=4686 RepID=A0A5P1FLX8_ASPOF|nr:uncharacterized protein A4U43_C02F9380 [Asparagus officinalis]
MGTRLTPARFDIDCDDFLPQLKSAGYSALSDIIHRHAVNGNPVSCIINNPFLPWVLDLAQELEIPSAVLWIQSCAVFSTYYHFYHSLQGEFPSLDNPDGVVSLPGLPELKPDELPTFVLPSNPFKTVAEIFFAQFENMHKATWVFANSFEELEREAIRGVCDRQRIIPRPNSVVYVSVGSVVVLTEEEVVEMANGLLNCGQPFLWVVRDKFRDFLPENFTDSAKENGMVVSWSRQERVLAHPSVGCFLTHCGWNSTLEALTAGVPVVAYPQWGDQVPGAKFFGGCLWGWEVNY